MNLKIALVGDYNHEVTAHRAIPIAIGNGWQVA